MITVIPDNQIKQTITSQLAQFGTTHLLIDPKINDEFFFENYFEFESIVPIRDRQDTILNDHECIQLCTLLKGTSNIDDIINCLKDNNISAIAIIFSSYSIKDIQKQISNAMFMRYNSDYYFLRFYDPHVLKHLITIFKNTQLTKLLGVIEYWYYWNDGYIELHHKPEILLTDIDYQITTKQWHDLNIAQAYNSYEFHLINHQHKNLTITQQETLKRLLDWAYTATYNQPDKTKLDYIINHAMQQPQQFLEKIDYDLFFDLINHKDINQLKLKLKNLQEGINNVFIG
jgi:hypothetical protein